MSTYWQRRKLESEETAYRHTQEAKWKSQQEAITMKHTKEPWKVADPTDDEAPWNIRSADKHEWYIARISPMAGGGPDTSDANAERIVSCVNACAGINPEAVPALRNAVDGLLSIFDEQLSQGIMWDDPRIDRARKAIAKTVKE